jgi:outer membrane protein TolC
MSAMPTRIWVAFLLMTLPTRPVAAQALSRAQAVAIALGINPEIKRSEDELDRLGGIVTEAKADALPELKVYGDFTRYRDPSLLNSSSFDKFPPDFKDQLAPEPSNLYDAYATLKQTLFSFKVGKAIRGARLAKQAGAEDIQRARQAVALLAVTSYNDYLLARERVRVAENAVRQKEVQLETTRNRRAAGVATDLEVLRFEVDRENARAQELRLQGAAEIARGRLNAVMVRPIGQAIEPTDRLEYLVFDVSPEEAVQAAWANRPEIKRLALEERVRTELVGIAKSDALPSLDFAGAFGWSVRKPENFGDSEFQRWSAAFTLTVPVFDGFRTAGKVAQAKAELNKVGQDRVSFENQVRLEARDAVDRLAVAKRVLDVAELTLKQARRALDMIDANYKHGAATLLDVIDAQAAVTEADLNRVEALYTHANARATLRFVMAQDPLDPPTSPPPTPTNAPATPPSQEAGTRP